MLLMTPPRELLLASAFVILMMGSAFGAFYVASSSAISNQQQSISGLESTVSSLLSHPVTQTVTTTATLLTTPKISTTTSAIQTVTQLLSVPFDNPLFMDASPGPDGGTCSTGYCWGSASYAIRFDCGGSVPARCPVNFYNRAVDLNLSIVASWQGGQPNQPTWSNCSWKSYWISPYPPNAPPSISSEGYGYCVSTGPTAFIIAMPRLLLPA
jgi:hypothetical protein